MNRLEKIAWLLLGMILLSMMIFFILFQFTHTDSPIIVRSKFSSDVARYFLLLGFIIPQLVFRKKKGEIMSMTDKEIDQDSKWVGLIALFFSFSPSVLTFSAIFL
jgi:hypothetical protein